MRTENLLRILTQFLVLIYSMLFTNIFTVCLAGKSEINWFI